MALLLVFIAALFGAASNFCMRRSIDLGGSTKAFLVLQLLCSFLAVFFLTNVRSGDYHFNMQASGIGIPGGILLGAMMWAVGRSLETGPSGLTFAIQNSASVMPAIVMSLFFGISCGHVYTTWNAIGSAFVIGGLFWAGSSSEKTKNRQFWLIFISIAFFTHVLYISFMQWRVLLLNPAYIHHKLIPFCIDGIPSEWFMPMIFLVAALIQLIIYLVSRVGLPNKKVILWGVIGGGCNGANLFFLIKATESAKIYEKAMLFPISCVSTIVLCNLWAQLYYKEKVNWSANILCLIGLAIGSVNWSALF